MLHARHNLITADPSQLSDSVKFIESEVRPNVESQPGNLGLALQLNPELGVAILESFWVSGDALRVSERVVAPSRAAAVRRATGTVTVERGASTAEGAQAAAGDLPGQRAATDTNDPRTPRGHLPRRIHIPGHPSNARTRVPEATCPASGAPSRRVHLRSS